jgi:protease IV
MKKLLIVFLLLLGIAVAATVAGIVLARKSTGTASNATVLTWRMDRPLVEHQAEPELPFLPSDKVDTVSQLYTALHAAKGDAAVRGIGVYIQDAAMGLAKAEEVRRQLQNLRRAGKFVDCYMETAGEGSNGTLAYFLATACDRIELAPAGEVNLLGLYSEGLFLKGTFAKLKIDPDFHHVGAYKSASEIFTESEYTAPAEEAISALLDSTYDRLIQEIARARKLPAPEVRRLIDGGPYSAEEALRLKLVDALSYPDEFRERVKKRAKATEVALQDYAPSAGTASAFGQKRLAVVFALGQIVRGGGGQPLSGDANLGSDDLSKELRRVAEDSSVAAVVLRVDSPGGSALASDLILREVEQLKKRKPVIVSMSDVAASGGYYIASKANRIVAEATTLTGSIGVLGGKFVTRRLQEETLGMTHDPLKRGANADIYSTLTPFSPEQTVKVEGAMQRVYDTFVGHVAAGRKLSRETVHAVAQGRVWTGADAQRRGLVDDLGGFDRAIELAKQAAGLPATQKVPLAFYPERRNWIELFQDRRDPELEAALRQFIRIARPRAPGSLELPPEALGLTRPY